MKKLFFLPLSALLLCLLFSACKKDKNNLHFDYDGPCHCGVENPLEDLEWLHNTAGVARKQMGENFYLHL